MHPLFRSLSALVALIALVALAPVAGAATTMNASRSAAVTGETVVFDWQGLTDGTHEVELELSLDGGRWIRISPGLEPREGRFEWTVPVGLVGEARVRLRAGSRNHEQVIAEVALRLASETMLRPRTTSDDWWSVESHGAPATALGETATWSTATEAHTFTNDSSPTREPVPTDLVLTAMLAPSRPFAPVRPRAFAAPRSLPLRN